MKRAGVMRCTRELVEDILRPHGVVIDCFADKVGSVNFIPLHKALLLPADAAITGVSAALFFDRDEIAIRIESPSFVATEPGNCFPCVMAEYSRDDNGPVFLCWSGPAVAIDVPQIVGAT